MKPSPSFCLSAALFICTALPTLWAADPAVNWGQWRGPVAKGIAPQGNPPTKWSETENLKWKTKLPGFGTSTPIIWENQVFVLTAIPSGKKAETAAASVPPPAAAAPAPGNPPGRRGGGGMRSETPTEAYQFVVLALDRQTGKVLWQKVAKEQVPHEGHHRDHGFASASPVTDGELLFASFGSRGLFCYDLQGNLKWEKDLGDMQTRNSFGEGTSPALHGDTLVINWDHEGEDFVVALDKRTGAEKWRQKRDEPTTWSTPLILDVDGKTQVIVSATNRIRSYDLATGAPLWQCGGMTTNVIPTPVSDFGLLYAISGFRGAALLAIKLGQSGDLTDKADAIAWKHGKGTPYVPSPLLYGERLYFFSGNNGILSCFNAKSGQALFEGERLTDLLGVYASPVGANDRVYLVGREGKSVVIKNSDKLEILATNQLADKFDASAAIVGKELYLRGHEYLYCLAE